MSEEITRWRKKPVEVEARQPQPAPGGGDETLHANEWLSLKVVRDPERGVNGYVYSHETRCKGRIVAVLPYRDTADGREYLVKSECTPCWSMSQVLSAVTGGWEGVDIAGDAVRELAEETGYAVTAADLVPLGESYASKSSDTVYSLFAVNLSGLDAGEAAGDGSRLEAESSAVWVSAAELAEVKDPQVALMALRLQASQQPQPAPELTPEGTPPDVRPRADGRRGLDITCGQCGEDYGTNVTDLDQIECVECEARRCPRCLTWYGGNS